MHLNLSKLFVTPEWAWLSLSGVLLSLGAYGICKWRAERRLNRIRRTLNFSTQH